VLKKICVRERRGKAILKGSLFSVEFSEKCQGRRRRFMGALLTLIDLFPNKALY
jgi:hypothetical protein